MTKPVYAGWQLTSLVILRWLIGWHLLYEGIAKLLNPYWTSAGFLAGSPGPLAGPFLWMASDPGRLAVVDFLNEWGLVMLGLGLLLGACTRTSTVLAMVLLALYYLGNPPWLGIESAVPAEGSYLVVNKTLIELAALGVLLVFPTGRLVGLDGLWGKGEAR